MGSFFAPGGGGGQWTIAEKILATCPYFYKAAKGNKGYNMIHKDKPTYEVKIFLHLNILFELITLDTIVGRRVNIGIFSINVNKW